MQKITEADFWNYVSDKIFKLKPEEYDRRYPKWPGMVGLELELFPVSYKATGGIAKKVMHPLFGKKGDWSSSEIVIEWGRENGYELTFLDAESKKEMLLIAESAAGDRVSFEPGGQVEISLRPMPCLAEALCTLEKTFKSLSDAFARYNVTLERSGIFSYQNADEIGLQMTKPRYKAMNSYFNAIGPYGRQMMRQTCTLQVNLDFGRTEAELAKRFLLGFLLSPIATATFANSPQAAYATGHPSLGKVVHNKRAESWRFIDPSRTGIPQGLERIAQGFTKKSCVESYGNSLLNAEVIFISQLDYTVPPARPFTFKDWINHGFRGTYPTLEDLETHASLHFPEVRARGFMEIRSCDAQSEYWQSVVPSFYVGLLYCSQATDRALGVLVPRIASLSEDLKSATFEGYGNEQLKQISQNIFEIALDGLSSLASCFSTPASLERIHEFYKVKFEGGVTPQKRAPIDLGICP